VVPARKLALPRAARAIALAHRPVLPRQVFAVLLVLLADVFEDVRIRL